jgi:acyl-CoA synthetase (AMP-forming)/AMP-acid ligase II
MLHTANVGPGDRCVIYLDDPIAQAAAFFGALGAGGVGISVNELSRPRQIEHILRHSDASVLVTTRQTLAKLPRAIDTRARIIEVDDLSPESPIEPVRTEAEASAQITYTSGSTGQPKGVAMSHRALWAGVRIVASYLGLRSDDRMAGLLPFSFVYGFNQLTTALWVGATLVVDRSTLAAQIVATLQRERITVLAAVPPLWTQLLSVAAFRQQPLNDLRIMTCAGGRLSPASVRELRKSQPQARLFLMYGLTEVFRSTYLPPEEVDAHPDSMGRAIPESVVYVVRDDGELAEAGEIGELVHGGPTLGIGYFNDPEATARVYRPNTFLRSGESGPERILHSGDLVRRDESGLLYYVGRRDRIIKTLGFRVSPDEICDVVQASAQVTDAAVISERDDVRGERVVACVVLRPDGSLEALQRFCKLELPRHMQPARYIVRDSIPRNASGKHDILALTREVAAAAPAAPELE